MKRTHGDLLKPHDASGNNHTGKITGGYPAPAETGSIKKPVGYMLQDILAVVLQP